MDYMDSTSYQNFDFKLVTDNDVARIVKKIFCKKKSPGIDEICGSIIKENIDIIKLPISYIVNLSMETGIYPSKLKTRFGNSNS